MFCILCTLTKAPHGTTVECLSLPSPQVTICVAVQGKVLMKPSHTGMGGQRQIKSSCPLKNSREKLVDVAHSRQNFGQ